MDRLSGECAFSGVEKVIFGPGKVAAVGHTTWEADRTVLVVIQRSLVIRMPARMPPPSG